MISTRRTARPQYSSADIRRKVQTIRRTRRLDDRARQAQRTRQGKPQNALWHTLRGPGGESYDPDPLPRSAHRLRRGAHIPAREAKYVPARSNMVPRRPKMFAPTQLLGLDPTLANVNGTILRDANPHSARRAFHVNC